MRWLVTRFGYNQPSRQERGGVVCGLLGPTMTWFSLVAVFFTREDVRRRFLRFGHWIDRVLGLVFLALAGSLVLAAAR